jgi:hypothetical protein
VEPLLKGFCHFDGIPFYLKGGFMHPNELNVLQNTELFMEEATKLGEQYIEALKEQISRQKERKQK